MFALSTMRAGAHPNVTTMFTLNTKNEGSKANTDNELKHRAL